MFHAVRRTPIELGQLGLWVFLNTATLLLSRYRQSVLLPVPAIFTAAMNGANVVLNWQDNSGNEIQFYVERCQGAGCNSFIGVGASDANTPTWTDYNAEAGQNYSYRVRAWNSDGFSAYSNTATIITPGGTITPPLPPSSLEFIQNVTDSIKPVRIPVEDWLRVLFV